MIQSNDELVKPVIAKNKFMYLGALINFYLSVMPVERIRRFIIVYYEFHDHFWQLSLYKYWYLYRVSSMTP